MKIYKLYSKASFPSFFIEKFFLNKDSAERFIKDLDKQYNTDIFSSELNIEEVEVKEQ